MIPKKIHYCWFGKHEMPPLNLACFETWKLHLSDYEFVRWDESNYPKNNFTEYHLKMGNWAFVSDYTRLFALYTEGGIYIDTDFEILKPLDSLLNQTCFLAYQDNIYITNGIAGSVKDYIFFKDCMEYMEKRFEKMLEFHTSPIVTTNVIKSGNYNIKIYNSNYFYPYNPYDTSRDIKVLMHNMIKKETYAIHHWAKSWSLAKNSTISHLSAQDQLDRIHNHLVFGLLLRFWKIFINPSFPDQ